ncbi:MAG: 2OG-Fe(II) oxygenase [Wenzhouxiangella sp.]|nr:2OG-Fe(II) oxygenase [Wenzhouxiangella sp.]TVR94533.1 MAG: 2OG-Fe(II) oxygenase [Wenzhouxiangellaceae bacterium]
MLPLPASDQIAELAVLNSDQVLARVGESLTERGWWVGDNAVAPDLVGELKAELEVLRAADELQRAGIGRDLDWQLAERIRRDRIHWLSRSSPVQMRLLDQMEALRLTLNRELFLGLFEFEAHFAHYPPGAFYRRHLDSFRGAANRIISTVIYLNEDWREDDGGELLLYPPEQDHSMSSGTVTEMTRIAPVAGRLALFLSEEIPHEVLTARRDRYSIAGWFRLNASLGNQIDPPR